MRSYFFALAVLASSATARAGNPYAVAEKKIVELKSMVHRSHARAAAMQTSEKKASGLTAAQEARLFGKAPALAKPVGTSYARPWPTYMSDAEHKKLQEELRDRKLRLELRRRLASQPADASAEDKETAGLMNSLLNEAERKAGEKEPAGSLKPLSPEDAFGIDPDDKD